VTKSGRRSIAAKPRSQAGPHQGPPQSPPPRSTGRRIARLLAEVLVGLAALGSAAAGGGYVVERWHETKATIDVGKGTDQKRPFIVPLVVNNPSSIFTMWKVTILCHVDAIYSSGTKYRFSESGTEWGNGSGSIEPRRSANFSCDFPNKFDIHEGTDPNGPVVPLTSATMTLHLQYETHILLWAIPQQMAETFTLLNTSTGYLWITGSWLNSP
jgi:hypothetical protein